MLGQNKAKGPKERENANDKDVERTQSHVPPAISAARWPSTTPIRVRSSVSSPHVCRLSSRRAPLGQRRLDDGRIEIERGDARRHGRGEMYAMQTTASRTESRGKPSEGLFLTAFISSSALFKDWKD
jgi:hypothetical protein